MSRSRIATFFLSGLVSGLFISEGLLTLSARSGWRVGGEVLILPLVFLLVYMGIMIGRAYPERRRSRNPHKAHISDDIKYGRKHTNHIH